MKVNQQFIAERLRLSRTTVSRCFTHHPKINPETRASVLQMAAELGYDYVAPRNIVARRPAQRNCLAVLIGVAEADRDAVTTAREILGGISEKAAAEHLELALHYVDPAAFLPGPRARRIVQGVSTSGWKGLILVYPFKEEAVANLMRKFPTISVLEDYDQVEVDCVNADQIRGILHMVQHLHDLGHRRIGFLSWKYGVPVPWVERRLGAYVESLFRFGMEFEPRLVLNVRRDDHVPLDVLSRQVARLVREGVTGWVCAADHQAYRLVRDLRELGVRVPHECSVTGYDGDPVPDGLPQLTTIQMPFRDIGISSVVSLLRKMDHPTAPRRHILVSGREIYGETTGSAPKR